MPLQQAGKGDWRWLHKSLWEHQVACVLLKELEHVSSGQVPTNLQLNHRLLNDELGIVGFMADIVRFDESVQEKLFAIVLATRDDKKLSIAAANSMTVLNRAYVPFSGMDLSNVSIPHALLDGAEEAVWPAADAIVGNPPFLGGSRLLRELGEHYLATLRQGYAGRVPGGADLVLSSDTRN